MPKPRRITQPVVVNKAIITAAAKTGIVTKDGKDAVLETLIAGLPPLRVTPGLANRRPGDR